VSRAGFDHEIVIIDDCSTDRTSEVAQKLELEQPGVRSLRHPVNRGLGAAYKTGISAAKKGYVMMVPGDDAWPEDALVRVLEKVGEADIVIPYIEVAGDKTAFRRALSRIYTEGINLLFQLHVPYYNGIVVHRTELVRQIEIRADDFSYQTEALVKLLRRGHSFAGVPANTNARPAGRSKALEMRNVVRVASSVVRLFFSVHFSR
jgi:glycosyltransferase involved in cell wall biosynthesis